MQGTVGKTQRPSRRRERSLAGRQSLLPLLRTFKRLPSDSLQSESLPSRRHSICCNPGQCWLRLGARSKKLAHLTAEPVCDTLIGKDMDHVKECIPSQMRANQDSCGNDVPAAAGTHEHILKKSADPDFKPI